MAKVKFIYIGKTMEHLIPIEGFDAIKLSKSDKEKLYPSWSEEQIKETTVLYPQTSSSDGDKIFVCGIGWKKFGKTNKVSVPLFSGEVEDWDNYLKEYGNECLFYSLTGYTLSSMDCCAYNSVGEFYSIMQCKGGIEHYQKFVEAIEEIQNIQTQVFNRKLSFLSDYQKKRFIEENLFRPCFRVFILIMPPYLDTPKDDEKMERFYRKYRTNQIRTKHSKYKRMLELEGLINDEISANNSLFYYTKEYLDYKQEYDAIRTTITNKIYDKLRDEMAEGDKNKFPICMSDRIKFLFGDRCNELYSYILEDFENEYLLT